LPSWLPENMRSILPQSASMQSRSFSMTDNFGLYDWDMLYELGQQYESNWKVYLDCYRAAGIQQIP
jgi:DUF971 family protein